MKLMYGLVLVVIILIATACWAAPQQYKGKASICHIRVNDTFASVIRQYGKNYIQTKIPEKEGISALIYNDPKADAQLIITCSSYPFPGLTKAKVSGIYLRHGRYKGKKYFANKTFAKTGTAEGIILGATKKEILKKYPKAQFWQEDGNELGAFFMGTVNDLALSYHFILYKGVAKEINLDLSQ